MTITALASFWRFTREKKSLTRLIMFMSFVLVRTLINLSHIFPTTVKSDSRKMAMKKHNHDSFTLLFRFFWEQKKNPSNPYFRFEILNDSELMKNPRCLFFAVIKSLELLRNQAKKVKISGMSSKYSTFTRNSN